jgi:hypothetical protein
VQVNPNGSKLWHLKYRFADMENRLAFGPFPTVTLAMAREQRTEAQRLLREKVDPGEYKKQAKRAAKVAAANSFEAVAREWFAKFSPKWAESHSCKVLLRLENDLIPWLGSSGHDSARRAPRSVRQCTSMPRDIEPDFPLCDRNQPGQAKPGGGSSRRAAAGAR